MTNFDGSVVLEGTGQSWNTGQNILEIQVTLGHNEKSSNCKIVLADPDHLIAEGMIAHSLATGGIVGLPESSPTAAGNTAVSGYSSANIPTEDAIIAECLAQGVKDKGQIAYTLATAKHESAGFTALVESDGGNPNYFDYLEGREDLGNTQPGDGLRFKGRGLVQVTGRRNYRVWSGLLGIDFIANPERMEEPAIALTTLVVGMRDGLYTGAKLPRYVFGSLQNFIAARAVVNGNDEAALIATYARDYLAGLGEPVSEADTTEGTKTPPEDAGSTTTATAAKGAILTVNIGPIAFLFVHTGTNTNNLGTTGVLGQGVRWQMARRKANRARTDVTLSQVASQIAEDSGTVLDYRSEFDPAYTFLEQRDISDYRLLQREAKRNGLFVSEENGTLVIRDLASITDTSVVLRPGLNLMSWAMSDAAISGLSDVPADTQSLQQENKGQVDPVSGTFTQTKADVTADKQEGQTGESNPAVAGTLAPGTDTVAEANRGKVKRVQGLPSTFRIPLSLASLALTPLSAVRTEGLPGELSRVWMVDTVRHSLKEGTTTLSVFSPVEALDIGTDTGTSGGTTAGTTSTTGWRYPAAGIITSPPAEFDPSRGRAHKGIDIANDTGTPIVAMNSGTVTTVVSHCVIGDTACGGGWGNYVVVAHDDGYESLYGHMVTGGNKKVPGNTVAAGDILGDMGTTGSSTGPHVHAEVTQNGRAIFDWPGELGLATDDESTVG